MSSSFQRYVAELSAHSCYTKQKRLGGYVLFVLGGGFITLLFHRHTHTHTHTHTFTHKLACTRARVTALACMRTPTHIHQHTHGRAHTSRARQALQGWVLWNGIHETPRAYMWGRIWHYLGIFQVDPGAVTLYGLFAVHMNEIEAPIWFGWGDCRLTRHSRTKKSRC